MISKNILLLLSNDAKKNAEVETALAQRGYAVFRVASQDDAVRKMRTKTVDLLICEASFVSGQQKSFSDFIEESGDRYLPVILMPEDMRDEEKELFKDLPGVRATVPKPLDISQLEKMVIGNLPEDSSVPGLEPDDDSQKALYDRRDYIGIDIGVFVKVGGGEPLKAALVEYGEGTVLLDLGKQAVKKDQILNVIIKSTGPNGDHQVEFQGKVLIVEQVEESGVHLVTVDSSSVGSEFAKKIVGQVTRRQSELLRFIRDTQD
jgi:hypothetical protein